MKENILALIFGSLIAIPIVLGVYWLIWELWHFVLENFCTTCSANIVHPSYWSFCGLLLLFAWVCRMLKNSK